MAESTRVRSPQVTTGDERGLRAQGSDGLSLPRRDYLACRHHVEACHRHHVVCRHHAAVFKGAVRSDSALFVCLAHPKGRR
jgi:hypothetical protein